MQCERALVEHPGYCQGWLCFFGSLMGIGAMTAVIGDVAAHFGCSVGLKDSLTAIGIVAMGTSIPDTFASKVAAIQDETADNSVGNVTGSNAVNVFLGIGVAWTIAACYHAYLGEKFYVDPGRLVFLAGSYRKAKSKAFNLVRGSACRKWLQVETSLNACQMRVYTCSNSVLLAFSVTIFCTEAATAILILVARRHPSIGGELGGPRCQKYFTMWLFLILWFIYISLSSLEVYGEEKGERGEEEVEGCGGSKPKGLPAGKSPMTVLKRH
ncbi:hypothetical protein RUM43_007826 [Polyplax serrata]|uniref:Sodium/calcium exchanger membrane region domain-containing protein n=1 Tax=Polyplax serrata TaxID=468196 RepID=A0AAN8Q6H4_POLSC